MYKEHKHYKFIKSEIIYKSNRDQASLALFRKRESNAEKCKHFNLEEDMKNVFNWEKASTALFET